MDLLIRTKIFSTADKGLSSNFQEACFHDYGYTIKNNFVLDNVYREYNDIDIIIKVIKDNNYGAIFENAVAQEFSAHGFDNLYYFNSKKQGEVDFVIEYKGEVLPIEVKLGKDYKRHSALDNLLTNENYDIKEAYILCNGNVERTGKRLYLPIYVNVY